MKLLVVLAILAASASSGIAARLFCYYTNWSRFGDTKFNIEEIDTKLCTHIVYSFWGLDSEGRVVSVDSWNDFGDEWTEGGLKRFVKLKNSNPSVKLILGVGGWNLGPLPFLAMLKSPEKRRNFLDSSLNFIRQYKFDGLEIDLIYQGGGSPEHKNNLTELVKEMKPKYQQNGFILSLATSGNPIIFDDSYDIAALSKNLDLINVLAYDLHGSWDGKTGHVAPLRAMKGENAQEQLYNVESVLNRCISHGAPPEKLNLMVVGYGRTFTLANPNNNGFNAPTTGPGKTEPLPYRTFCVQNKNNYWNKRRNDEQEVPYAYSGNQWVGYEDVKSLVAKVKLAKSKKLGGISFWSLDMDDFRNVCDSGKFPLLKAVKEELFRA